MYIRLGSERKHFRIYFRKRVGGRRILNHLVSQPTVVIDQDRSTLGDELGILAMSIRCAFGVVCADIHPSLTIAHLTLCRAHLAFANPFQVRYFLCEQVA